MRRKSSPCEYRLKSANSGDAPRRSDRCSPARPSVRARPATSERRRKRASVRSSSKRSPAAGSSVSVLALARFENGRQPRERIDWTVALRRPAGGICEVFIRRRWKNIARLCPGARREPGWSLVPLRRLHLVRRSRNPPSLQRRSRALLTRRRMRSARLAVPSWKGARHQGWPLPERRDRLPLRRRSIRRTRRDPHPYPRRDLRPTPRPLRRSGPRLPQCRPPRLVGRLPNLLRLACHLRSPQVATFPQEPRLRQARAGLPLRAWWPFRPHPIAHPRFRRHFHLAERQVRSVSDLLRSRWKRWHQRRSRGHRRHSTGRWHQLDRRPVPTNRMDCYLRLAGPETVSLYASDNPPRLRARPARPLAPPRPPAAP